MNEVPEKEHAGTNSENTDAQHGGNPQGEESPEPLLDTVQRTLEELLSRQSLEDDAYIQQNMNAQMYIPLTTLASHYSIRCLADEATVLSLIKPAAERSEKVVLDESGLMARPCMKPRRNTLILHDLPDNFPEEELKSLLESSPGSEAFCSLKPDVNNTAFVTFETDEAAQNVALWLRSQKLQGSGIKCAIKSEHVVRSFFPASPGIMPDSSPYMGPWSYPAWTPGQDWGEDWSEAAMNNMWWSDTGGWMLDEMQGDNGKGKGKGKGKGRRRGPGSFSLPDAQMEMLPRGEMTQDGLQQSLADDAEVVEPGYTHQYREYSRQQIIDTCNAMEEIAKPDSYERLEQNEVALFRSSPCKDWAPPPNPLAAFASSFFNEDGKGRDSQDADGNRRSSAASRKGSWGPRDRSKTRTQSDVSQSTDNKEESWGNGDSSWWGKGRSSSSTRRSSSHARSWSRSRGTSWDYNSYSHADGGYQNTPHWVKKDNKTEDESPPEILADAHSWPTVWVKKGAAKNEEESQQEQSGDSHDTISKDLNEEKENRLEEAEAAGRKLSWAEKVKGIKAADESTGKGAATPSSPPVAKPKGKVDGSMSPKKMPNDSSTSPMTKTLSNHSTTANQNSRNDQIGPAPGLEAEVKTGEAESKTSGTPTTWADRMRKSVSQ